MGTLAAEDAARRLSFLSQWRLILGPDPALGAELTLTVPGGTVWIPYSLQVVLVTSAVVANRQPQLTFTDSINEFARVQSPRNIPANTTYRASWMRGMSYEGLAGTLLSGHGGLPEFLLLPGWRIITATTNIDVNDNYAIPILMVRELDVTALEEITDLASLVAGVV